MPKIARSSSHETRRDAASRNLLDALGPTPELDLPDIRSEHLDVTLGDQMNITHPVGDYGEAAAQRRHMLAVGMKISPTTNGLGMHLLDLRGGRLNVGCWFSFNFEDAGDLGAGMARILPHNGFAFTRPTRAWVDDPRGNAVRCIEPDLPRPCYLTATQGALVSERRGSQLIARSSFGTSGLPAHTGAGTTTQDTESIFDSATNGVGATFQRLILTAGNPHGSDGVQAYNASSTAVGGGFLTLSFYHEDDGGATLYWKMQRASDAAWWNEGSRVWQAGTINNAMPLVVTTPALQVAARGISSSATTYTVSLVQPSGGTVSRVNKVHHAQLEEKGFESSPIPLTSGGSTDGCPGFRDDDLLQVCNDTGARVFVAERGTMLTRFVPRWSTADAYGLKLYVFAVEYDSNNYIALYYDGVASTRDRFVLEVRAGGSTTVMAAVYAVTRYTEVRLGMRWASGTYDELGSEYGTPAANKAWYDLWAGAAVLLTGTEATVPTQTDASRLQVMCRDGENIDAYVEDFMILKAVLTAAEMAAAL